MYFINLKFYLNIILGKCLFNDFIYANLNIQS